MKLLNTICISEEKCINKNSLICNKCTRNVNRTKDKDYYEFQSNWALENNKEKE
jgi:hypothetical protein